MQSCLSQSSYIQHFQRILLKPHSQTNASPMHIRKSTALSEKCSLAFRLLSNRNSLSGPWKCNTSQKKSVVLGKIASVSIETSTHESSEKAKPLLEGGNKQAGTEFSEQEGNHGFVFTAEELAQATGGTLLQHGSPGSISTDSRKFEKGDWFLALKGDNYDGHVFLTEVAGKGCEGAIGLFMPTGWSHGFVLVDDTLLALQRLGSYVRSRFRGPVVAITGSSGKTGTRVMTGLALRPLGPVHETSGNLNNHIGVPLTLLATPNEAKAMVLELGMNHANEITELADICRPTVRLITNVGPVHLEGLGSIEAVAKAKGELFDAASKGDVIVLNMDDPLVLKLPLPDGIEVVRYGSATEADVRAINIRSTNGGLGVKCVLQRRKGDKTIESTLLKIVHPGLHLVQNALAAAAVAVALGVPLKEAVQQIQKYEPVGMRMRLQRCSKNGITLLNDAYNANPMSVKVALDLLSRAERGGRKVACLGDMLELGEHAHALHEEVLQQCASKKIDVVAVCGPLFQQAVSDLGLEQAEVKVFSDSASLAEAVSSGAFGLAAGDLVLVKGSRGLKMEVVCTAIETLEQDAVG